MRPDRYVVQTCTVVTKPPGCVRAAVEDGRAIATEERIFAAGIGWEAFDVPRDPLESMFDELRDVQQASCELDHVDYDKPFGFVESFEFMCDDGESGGRWVACFEPDTLDLQACNIVPVT